MTTGFRIPSCLSVVGLLAAVFLAACQPLIQAQTGAQTTIPVVPVVFPKTENPAPATSTDQPQIRVASTALTEDEISAEPATKAIEAGQLRTDNVTIQETEPSGIVVSPVPQPDPPAVKPVFNPAGLVGRSHAYVKTQFGQADFNRTEGIIHVLQYHQPDCVIDFFISLANPAEAKSQKDAKIMDWAMRERVISQPLDHILCQQQFYERKL